MSAVMDSRMVTARKAHICESCLRRITPGERYHRAKSVDYDGWRTWRACQQCTSLADDLWTADVRGEDDDGNECYSYLPDVDWHDIRLWSPLWALRADLYAKRWDGRPYPVDDPTHTTPITVHGIPAEDHHADRCAVCRGKREDQS